MEAGATQCRIGIHTQDGVHRRYIADDGCGMTADNLIAFFGKSKAIASFSPGEFAGLRESLSKKWGLVRLANEIVS